MNWVKLIREQEKTKKIDRCMKCEKILTSMEERDIAVCIKCSKRKYNKRQVHLVNAKAVPNLVKN